jgi:hypothetical protein
LLCIYPWFFWLSCPDFVFVLGASQQSTTRYNNRPTATINNLNNNLQRKQQHTQQSSRERAVSFAGAGSPLFLSVDLVRFFVCAASVTTINSTQQQQQKLKTNQQSDTTIYNKRNNYNSTHTNQTVGEFLLLVLVCPCFFL